MIRASLTGPVRDRLVDLGLVAVSALAALTISGEAEEAGRLTGGALTAALGLALLGVVALCWRRRFPIAVAVLLALLLVATDLVIVAVLIAVYTVSARRGWFTTAATVGFGLLIYVPYSVVLPGDLSAFNANVLYVALISIAMAVGSTTRARGEAVAALQERAERAEIEAQERAERLRVQERHRIAGEMHDVLAHRISLVSLQASALEVRDLPADVAEAAAGIRMQSHRALEDLREILGVLRVGTDAAGLRPQPGLADLGRLVAEARDAGTEIHVDQRVTGEPSDSVGRTVYRLVQEGLTNARKHAPGAPVEVLLLEQPGKGELRVRLRNPLVSGNGTKIPGSHSGLVSLAERVALAGGRLSYGMQRVPQGGVVFQLEAWLPWPT